MMKIVGLKFKYHLCFKQEFAGFEEIKPVNIVIGRNNSGKSALLDIVPIMCKKKLRDAGKEFYCRGILDEGSIQQQFQSRTQGGHLAGDHWANHGRLINGKEIKWIINRSGSVERFEFSDGFEFKSARNTQEDAARRNKLIAILERANHQLAEYNFRKLQADRDIFPEVESTELKLEPDGSGATNIVRRLLLASNPDLPRELVQADLLNALNEIFAGDGSFSEIQIQHHDEHESNGKTRYEVFLGEETKGLIPLSRTGSGLKTILLILLNLVVLPKIGESRDKNHCFCFEEPENNLHPALLRRLFKFIESYAVANKTPVFLTTHSSTALDVFGLSENTQIIRVSHDGEQAKANRVVAHFDKLNVVSELGASPSDLLQANGVIWVEGPSDRLYVNRWIELVSEGRLLEGKDYQCAFYGGALLAQAQFVAPENQVEKWVNLLRINQNVIVICDGDRKAPSGEGSRIKDRVRRVKKEVDEIPGSLIWITKAREIENYLTADVLGKVFDISVKNGPDKFQPVFPRKAAAEKGNSYIEKVLRKRGVHKVELALACVPHIRMRDIEGRFDLLPEVQSMVRKIDQWAG